MFVDIHMWYIYEYWQRKRNRRDNKMGYFALKITKVASILVKKFTCTKPKFYTH